MSDIEQSSGSLSAGFPPIAAPDARILILGSLPGRMSLERVEYYGQPRNAFWQIAGDICGAGPALPYDQRVAALQQAGIALWDVIAAAERPGSLDSAIVSSTIRINDFQSLFDRCGDIGKVFFNGRTAEVLYSRHVVPMLRPAHARLPQQVLPSTSPANAGMRPEEKRARWRAAIGPALGGERFRTETCS